MSELTAAKIAELRLECSLQLHTPMATLANKALDELERLQKLEEEQGEAPE